MVFMIFIHISIAEELEGHISEELGHMPYISLEHEFHSEVPSVSLVSCTVF